ncbi:hypothetical protein L6R52_07150 [Myxococcota bacterium]|nr:hypothetical protein [Myxococcota bacterium]
MNTYRSLITTTLALGLALAACSSTEEVTLDEEACELITATATPITAGSDRATAPMITPGETPYLVTTATAGPSYVRFDAAEAGDWVFYLALASVSTGKYFVGDTEAALPAAAPNDPCPTAIQDHYHVEVVSAGTVALELAPSAVPVKIVVHPEEGEHGHE